jgi:hypothetical protein
MNAHAFTLAGEPLEARPAGALWLPRHRTLVVSDLHLGKSERMARRGGALLPPYEVTETLSRLEAEIAATDPDAVLCLGDSFDDPAAAAALPDEALLWLLRLQAGRRWLWVEGNHDPGPIGLGGSHHDTVTLGPLTFRHIADPSARAEVSGHYHPKCDLPGGGRSRPAFLYDADRLILPAFGAYTGGLRATSAVLQSLFPGGGLAVLTGRKALAMPMPRPVSRPQRATRPPPGWGDTSG